MTPVNDPYNQYQPPYNPYMANVPPDTSNYGQKFQGQSFTQPGMTSIPKQALFQNQMQSFPSPKGPPMPSGSVIPPSNVGAPATPAPPRSYMENIFVSNRGKVATFYFTFQNNPEWNAKVIKGILLAAGRDYVIIKEVASDRRWLMPTLNFDFAVFDEDVDR